ncbi:hypothetical protein D3C72_429190 [compost metagenome]
MIPAELVQTRHVQQFTRCAIGLSGVEHHASFVAHHLGDGLRQFANGAINASTDVDVRQHRLGVLSPHLAVQLHHVNTGGRHIIHVQELAHRRPAAPHHHIRGVFRRRFVEPTQQRRDHVRITRVEVIVRTVQIGRHHRAIVAAILAVIGFAQFDPGNFCNRVGFVRRFQRSL